MEFDFHACAWDDKEALPQKQKGFGKTKKKLQKDFPRC